MDYYQKYLKYKNKYLILRRRLYGGELTEEQKITDFNTPQFRKIQGGMESNIYLDITNNLIYKVFIKRKDVKKGPWSIQKNIAEETFKKSVDNYKKASTLNLGPQFYGSYFTDTYNIIVMEFIDGYTLTQKNINKFNLKDRLKELINDLIKNELIPSDLTADIHLNNFMYRPKDDKLFAIDL